MAVSNAPPIISLPRTEIPAWLFFCIFVAFASVRAKAASADSDSDDALSDFTNDLFTDLGPLLALFGEQMTKQYISESTTYYDYFIFGMGPIGVLTTIVSTIRLCGPASLRAFIGRSQEGNSAIEAELCTSTSRDVCEVFNNGGITRMIGRPKLLELIRVPRNYLPSASAGREINREAGLYLLRDFLEDSQRHWDPESITPPEWSLYPWQQLSPASQNPPNLSLNVGITQYDPWVFRLVALLGLILQAGVLVVAGVGVWVLGWNLNDSTTASKNHAPTMFIVGTVFMCGGMCACIAIIGQATTEVKCKRKPSVTPSPVTSLIWFQPRQVIADQSFDAYAFIEEHKNRLMVWTSSMKTWDLDPGSEFKFKLATCSAVLAVLVGYILQFIGLRGMRAWVSIAQLITTVAMSILRGVLRMQRVTKENNQLLSKVEIVQGHELDWLAVEISQRDSQNEHYTLKEGHTKLTEAKSTPPWTNAPEARSQPSYQNLMNLRVSLSGITGHVPRHFTQTRSRHAKVPWGAEFSKVHDKAEDLAAALEQVANIFLRGEYYRMISLNLPGSQFCRPPGITNNGTQNETGFNVHLERPYDQSTSKWRIDHVGIEAILGLALWSLISDRRLLYWEVGSQLDCSRAEDVPKKRITSAGLGPHMINGELKLACWEHLLRTSMSNSFRPPFGLFEEMTVPLDPDLDSYSLGSLWQVHKPPVASDAPIKGLKEKHWLDMPGGRVVPAERLCGWSCVLGAQQNIERTTQSLSEKALGHSKKPPKTICLQLATTKSSLLQICTQEVFGAFLALIQARGGDYCSTFRRRFEAKQFEGRVEAVKAITQIFVGFGLGSHHDAIDCILPALDYRQTGDHDRVISIFLSTCDLLLEKAKQTTALGVVADVVAILRSRQTREEERFFARALCMLSKIQRFEMGNYKDSKVHNLYFVTGCNGIWEGASERPNIDHFGVATIKKLYKIHVSLWKFHGDNEGEQRIVWDTLLEAVKDANRFATMRSLCRLTKNGLGSSSAEEKQSASSALPLVAKQGWFEAVDALLSIGVDPLAQDEAGRTALGYCAEYGQFEHEVCAEILLSHERALDALKCVSWSTDDGCTPLLLAIDQGHEEMVRILLKNGCAVNEQGGREFSPLGDLSPLGDAIANGHEGIVRQLIDAGAELRPEHLDAAKDGNSPGIKQLIFGYLKLVVPECPDFWMGHMPEVIEHGDLKAVQLLLDRGVKYHFEDILLAVRKGRPEVKDLFLGLVHSYAAEFPNHTTEWLSKLAEEGDQDTLQALLDHGASVVWDGA